MINIEIVEKAKENYIKGNRSMRLPLSEGDSARMSRLRAELYRACRRT